MTGRISKERWTLQKMREAPPSDNIDYGDSYPEEWSDWQWAFITAEFSDYSDDSPGENPWRSLHTTSFDPFAIVNRIIAADEGVADHVSWLALFETTIPDHTRRYALLFAGCCYTGWDVKGGGNVEYYPSLPELFHNLNEEQTVRLFLELRDGFILKPEWKTPTVISLVSAIDQLTGNPTLTQDEMPVLADALEEAGADEESILWFRHRNLWALWSIRIQVAGMDIRSSIYNPDPLHETPSIT